MSSNICNIVDIIYFKCDLLKKTINSTGLREKCYGRPITKAVKRFLFLTSKWSLGWNDLYNNDDTFSMDELRIAKKSLRDGKQAGPDNIPPEVLKSCNFDQIILDFANNLLEKMEKPKQLLEKNPIPVSK